MPIFESFDDENSNQIKSSGGVNKAFDFTEKKSKGVFLTRVFGVMALCLLVTAIVAGVLGYVFNVFLLSGEMDADTALVVLTSILGVSAVGLFIMSFVLPITFVRGKHNILVPLIIYIVLMGILLSSFIFVFDWFLIAEAFGITSLVFGVMALLGYVSKGNLTGIKVILSSLIIGALLLAGINFITLLLGGLNETNFLLSMGTSLLIFAFLMLVTLYDTWRIKKIAEQGEKQNNNLVLYCAYILYSDFIAILVRVVYYLAIFTSKKN